MTELELSIVIAAGGSRRTLCECLTAIHQQIGARAVEMIVVAQSAAEAETARKATPSCVVLDAPPNAMAPHLWALGIGRASGRIVALTSGACVPDANWLDEIIRAHAEYHSGIGGALEMADNASLLDRAAFLVRWSRHMPPIAESNTDLPGENASYKRAALADDAHWIAANGFWPQDVGEHLRGQMRSLRSNPAGIVRVNKPYTFGGIIRQQARSGQLLGAARARRSSAPKRVLYLLATPLIPLFRLRRIAQDVARKRRHGRDLVVALPLILVILACEATGEFIGMAHG